MVQLSEEPSSIIGRMNSRDWQNWIWQQQHAFRNLPKLAEYFSNIDSRWFAELEEQSSRLKFQITPYILSQIPRYLTKEELCNNPWFLQFFPQGKIYQKGHDAYDGTDNWENPKEFPTRLIHHKYPNRVLIRFRDCFGYCSFCFEALGILEKNKKPEKQFKTGDWEKSLEYISVHPEIEEVVFSGGDPLFLSDQKLEGMLENVSQLQQIRFIRFHTRVLSFNPFRITPKLLEILSYYDISEIAFNVAHPSEITPEFKDAVLKIRKQASPILAAHIPLLRHVNDNTQTLRKLFLDLYEIKIKPYYLLHTMPHTPFADKQRVSVRDGVRLIKPLKRQISNIAFPEYVIVHYDGKQTVPLELNGTPEFQYTKNAKGKPVVKFLNWQGKWCEYPDTEDRVFTNAY